MANHHLEHRTSPAFRGLCLIMSSLMMMTGCSTTRSQNTWRNVGKAPSASAVQPPQMADSWGARPEGLNVVDPQIVPGFLLNLSCLADSKLNGDFRVEYNGDLSLPYDITLNSTAYTLSHLQKRLAELYRPYFKTASDIEVRVKERRYWLDVRGLVEKPGRYLVEPDASLDQVIGLAGGLSKITTPLSVRIQKGSKVFVLDLSQYYSQGEDHPQILGWLGGEVLFFQRDIAAPAGDRTSQSPSRLSIYMLGEVRRPGEYTLNPGSDFVDTLVQAGGFTERADLDYIEVIRRTGGKKRVFDFSWDEFQFAPTPRPGDIVLVQADRTTRLERHTTLVATLIAALATVVTSVVLVLAYNKGRI